MRSRTWWRRVACSRAFSSAGVAASSTVSPQRAGGAIGRRGHLDQCRESVLVDGSGSDELPRRVSAFRCATARASPPDVTYSSRLGSGSTPPSPGHRSACEARPAEHLPVNGPPSDRTDRILRRADQPTPGGDGSHDKDARGARDGCRDHCARSGKPPQDPRRRGDGRDGSSEAADRHCRRPGGDHRGKTSRPDSGRTISLHPIPG